jgi:two-component sensor histidine kinase
VTNALKYAYPDAAEGPIRVCLRIAEGHGVLAVQDEGIGSAAGEPVGTGLGRRIVEALSASVGGEVEHRAGPGGTTVSIHFALG